jgi:hypothetical protein
MTDQIKFKLAGQPADNTADYHDYSDLIKSGSDQRSQDWHDLRNGRATSSEISVLFPQRAPEKKFAEQHEGFGQGAVTYIKRKAVELYTASDIKGELDTYAVRWGKIMEPAAKKFYALMIGDTTITERGFTPYSKYAGGSPDFISTLVGVGEIKCPLNQENHVASILDLNTLDDLKSYNYKYWWQVQSLMFFLGFPWAVFISFDPRQLKAAWTPNDPEGFSPEYAFESATESEKKMAMHVVSGDIDTTVGPMIVETLPRFVRLRNRYVRELIEKKGTPEHLKDWKG